MRPRRAAEAFWRCEQAFERRTRDMTFFPPLFPPPFFFLFPGECTMLDGLGRPWSWASWIGVERLYRIMMGAG